MLYAILAYHEENVVASWTPDEDETVMNDLRTVHAGLGKSLGPAVRLGATKDAVTLRGPGEGMVIDGPFAEVKEHLLGFYVVDCAAREDAIAAARGLRGANPTAVYEIRPVLLYRPNTPYPETAA